MEHFLILFTVSAAILLVVALFRGPSTAVGVVAVVSFCYPRWIPGSWIDPDLDLPIATGLLALGYYCFDRRSEFRTKLVTVDYVFLAFLLTGIGSDFANDGFQWRTLLVAYCEWFVPYLLGRLAMNRQSDIRWLVGGAVLSATLISICCVMESAFKVNVFEWCFFDRESPLEKYLDRMGWQRAFGPTENPIYLGTMLILLLPWTAYYSLGNIKDPRTWWKSIALFLCVAGVLSSVSRAPILAIGVFPIVTCFLLFKSMRIPAAAISLLILMVGMWNWSSIKQDLRSFAGDNVQAPSRKIVLDGETVNYSSTDHRLLLWQLYRTAIQRAGLLGYGSDRTSVFPPNVPMGGEHDLAALKSLWCIDNQYLLLLLRFGFLGAGLWVLLLIVSMWAFASLAQFELNGNRVLFAFLASTIVALIFIQLTVWMPHDYGFVLLWTMGISAGATAANDRDGYLEYRGHYR